MCQAHAYFMETQRLGFGRWSMDDLPLVMALWADPEVTRLFGGPFSDEAARERLAREIDSMHTHKFQYWPVFLLVDQDFAGCCGLRPYKPTERIYELGFHFRPLYWGKGLATEAAQAVISHAVDTLGAKGLFAGHHPENSASRHVLKKLGFEYTHDERYEPTSEMHPSYLRKASA